MKNKIAYFTMIVLAAFSFILVPVDYSSMTGNLVFIAKDVDAYKYTAQATEIVEQEYKLQKDNYVEEIIVEETVIEKVKEIASDRKMSDLIKECCTFTNSKGNEVICYAPGNLGCSSCLTKC